MGVNPIRRQRYLLDQARLRPHESSASTRGFIYLTIRNQQCLNGFLPGKGLDASRKLRPYSVVNTSSRKPQGTLSLRASRHLPSRPYRTRDRYSRLASPRHHYFRGSRHHRVRIWSDCRNCHPSARQNFGSAHQPSSYARPHNRWKNIPRNVPPVHFIPSSRRTARGVHSETNLQPIRVPSRPRHYETSWRGEPSGWNVVGGCRDLRAGDVGICGLTTSSQEAGRGCADRVDLVRGYSRAGSANECVAKSGSKPRSGAGVRIFDKSLRLLARTLDRGFNCRTYFQILRAIQACQRVPCCLSVLRTRDEARWPRPSLRSTG